MTNLQASRLNRLLAQNRQHLIAGGLKGIEKESLRISKDGFISQKPHPRSLGSALTHPQITTDYSESLIELITPPYSRIQDTLHQLDELHRYVYRHLDNEILLCASMPCGIDGDEYSNRLLRHIEYRKNETRLPSWFVASLRSHHAGDCRHSFQLFGTRSLVAGASRGRTIDGGLARIYCRGLFRFNPQFSTHRLADPLPVRRFLGDLQTLF